jgi:hypothetical protein
LKHAPKPEPSRNRFSCFSHGHIFIRLMGAEPRGQGDSYEKISYFIPRQINNLIFQVLLIRVHCRSSVAIFLLP